MLLTLMAVVLLSACSSVTIQPEARAKISSEPSYHQSRHFFFWGLVGEERVNVKQVCGRDKVVQMQSQQTLADGALAFVTLGIYSPHSIKVWCEKATLTAPMEIGNED